MQAKYGGSDVLWFAVGVDSGCPFPGSGVAERGRNGSHNIRSADNRRYKERTHEGGANQR